MDVIKPGEIIYAIEVEDDYFDKAEVLECLYMGECGDYFICCSKNVYIKDFDKQLEEMYLESIKNCGVEVYLLKSDYCFGTKDEAYAYLYEVLQDYYED